MIRRFFSSCAAVAVLLMTEASAFAMTFMEPEEIMQATFDDGNRCVRGETFMRVTDLDGTKLVFIVHDEKSWRTNYVTLESADGKAVYCKFPAGRRVRQKIRNASFGWRKRGLFFQMSFPEVFA